MGIRSPSDCEKSKLTLLRHVLSSTESSIGWSAHKPESYVAAFNGEMKSLGATIKSHLHILFPKSPSEMLSPENPVLEIVQVILSESTADKEYTDVVHTIFEGSEHQVSKPLESEGDKARTFTTVAVWPSVEAAKASKEQPSAVEARGKLRSMCSGFVGHVQIADPQKA